MRKLAHSSSVATLVAALCALALGCSDGGSGDDSTRALNLGFTGLEPLGADMVYEGWIIVDGAPVSTGRFSVDEDGNPDSNGAEIDAAMVDAAAAFVLTIEPAVGDDPGPSDIHILAGDLNGGVATLTVDHPAALATDFTAAAGQFILETPSSAAEDDSTQGIWWLVPGDTFEPGLALPALPAGWAYEGWVVGPDGPVSTGRFTDPSGADSDLAGPAGGPDGDGPPFPGQDFIDPAVDLVGHAAVISVEPQPDNSPAPFTLKPLVTMSISDVAPPATQSMQNNAAATNPAGTASFE